MKINRVSYVYLTRKNSKSVREPARCHVEQSFLYRGWIFIQLNGIFLRTEEARKKFPVRAFSRVYVKQLSV